MEVHSQGRIFEQDQYRDLTPQELVGIDSVYRRVHVPVSLDMHLDEFRAML